LLYVVEQRIAKAILGVSDRRTTLEQKRAPDNDLRGRHQPMRCEARVLTEAVTNGEIDRIGAQIDNRITGLDGNLDCGMGVRKIGQSLDQPARGERGGRCNVAESWPWALAQK